MLIGKGLSKETDQVRLRHAAKQDDALSIHAAIRKLSKAVPETRSSCFNRIHRVSSMPCDKITLCGPDFNRNIEQGMLQTIRAHFWLI